MRRRAPMPERLIEAATAAFAARGFEGASTHEIAKAAGAPQGLVRHHFGSKDGLWSAVVERGLEGALADLEALPGGLTVAAWMAVVDRHTELAAVLVQALLEGGRRAEAAAGHVQPVLERLLAFQRRAQPDANLEQLAPWLAASLAGPLLRRARAPHDPSEGAAARGRELDLLFAWLASARPPQPAGPFAVQTARSQLRGRSY